MFGMGFAASYALAAFTLTLACCLPLALLITQNSTAAGPERVQALVMWLLVMGAVLAIGCVWFFFGLLRHRVQWQRHALMVMWSLSALGIVGWWKL